MDKRTEWEFEYEHEKEVPYFFPVHYRKLVNIGKVSTITVTTERPITRSLALGLVQYAKPEWKYTEGD